MYVRFFFIPIVLLSLTCSLKGQSAWDIEYLFEDSISSAHLGIEVKLDFIGIEGKLAQFKHPRGFISREDKGTLILCGTDTLHFLEKRSIHVDWGLYREQYLESSDYLNDESIVMRTRKSIIKQVKEDSIYFELHTSIFKVTKRKELNIGTKVFNIWVNRNDLDGVIMGK